MTVAELIQRLSQLHPDQRVTARCEHSWYLLHPVVEGIDLDVTEHGENVAILRVRDADFINLKSELLEDD